MSFSYFNVFNKEALWWLGKWYQIWAQPNYHNFRKNPYFAFYNNIIIMMKTRYLQCVLCTSRYKDKQTSKEHVSYSQIHCGVLSGKYIRTWHSNTTGNNEWEVSQKQSSQIGYDYNHVFVSKKINTIKT